MAPETGTAILVLTAFVLPGFITLLLRERSYVIPGESTPFERLLNALAYSAVIYGALLIVGYARGSLDASDVAGFYKGQKTLGEYLLLASLGLALLPIAIAQLGVRWRNWRLRAGALKLLGISSAHAVRSGWDEFFGSGRRAFVRATLSDGRVVGGYFGDRSLAGYTQESQDLYLEERWELDNEEWFSRRAPETLGVWLSEESITSIELYEAPDLSLEKKRSGRWRRWLAPRNSSPPTGN